VVKQAARLALRPKTESASIGKKIGGWVGDMAQKAIMAITGFGDYQVRSNSLVAKLGGTGVGVPAFQRGRHCTSVCHREFVTLVSSPGSAFNATTFQLNPSSSFFPWLSELALSWEQFAFRGAIVEFVSTSATAVASTNTALGSVIIATQYNVLAPPFATQQQMESYEFVTSCNPSQSMIHPIECDPTQNMIREFFVDQGFGGDQRLQVLGTTTVATVGQQAASIVGELWISYEIDLIRPKLFSGVANLGLSAHLVSNTVSVAASSFASNPYNLLTNPATAGSDLPITPAGATLTFPGWMSGFVLVVSNALLDGGNVVISSTAAPTVSSGGQIRGAFFNTGLTSADNPLSASTYILNSLGWCVFLFLNGSSPSTPVVLTSAPYAGLTGTANVLHSEVWASTMGISG
jgi:hypothetical protein